MIPVADALARLLALVEPLPGETVPLAEAGGRVMLDDAVATEPVRAGGAERVPGRSGQALRLDGDTGVALPGRLQYDRCDPWTVDLVLRDPEQVPESAMVLHRSFGTDVGYNGLEIRLAGGRAEVALVRDWPGNALGVRTLAAIPRGEWTRLTVSYDGSSRAGGIRVFFDGKRQELEVLADEVRKSIATRTHGNGEATIGARFRDRGFRNGEVDELGIWSRALSELEVEALERPEAWGEALGDPSREEALRRFWVSAIDPPCREAAVALQQARRARIAAEDAVFEVPVMRETPEPVPAHVLERGAYDAPRTEDRRVERDVFSEILPAFPAGEPRDRLGLARWLTGDKHPLTSRVFVNRIWAGFFGRGIVESADNFGLQGALPSHPGLLDWLARDFVDHGWDLKRLCRMIVLSEAYGRDGRVRADLRERDPGNRLLARGPVRRLAAEQLRDLALFVSGLLDERRGGPPVSPYQPGEDLWRESNSMSPPYRQSVGVDLHRRSVYSVWKRTAPLPNMLAFDAPTREVCTVGRPSTNTPLQALVLLNDVQFVEAARALAARVSALPADQRIAAAFRACATRGPTPRELELLEGLLDAQAEKFRADPKAAEAYLASGSSELGRDRDPVELAALAVVCQAILNLDSTVWTR